MMDAIAREPVRGGYPPASHLTLPGVERMRAFLRGEAPPPPIHHLTGIRPVEAGVGFSTFSMPASPWLQTHAGVFLGGWGAFVADAPFGGAVVTTLGPGQVATTSELSMSFLRPASVASRTLIARARIVHGGRSVGLSEVMVEDGRGVRIAHGTSRLVILEVPVAEEGPPPGAAGDEPAFSTPDPYERPAPGAVLSQEEWNRMGGLEMVHRHLAGEIEAPPFAHLLGLRIVDVGEGHVTFTMPASEWLHSPAAQVYGGALAVLADNAINVAVTTTIPPATSYGTLDLTMHFLRPVFGDGRDLTATGRVVHRGRSLAVATAEIRNADGKVVVMASGSAMITPGRPWPSASPEEQEYAPEPDTDA